MREIYKQKGYPDDWIEKRVRSIAVRDELTGEWGNRGVQEHNEFAILTAGISKATFGLTPAQYKNLTKAPPLKPGCALIPALTGRGCRRPATPADSPARQGGDSGFVALVQ